jgi:hypothetical protein
MPDDTPKTITFELTGEQTAAFCQALAKLAADWQRKGESRQTPPSNRQAYRKAADEITLMARQLKEAWQADHGEAPLPVLLDFGRDQARDRERAVAQAALAALPAAVELYGALGRPAVRYAFELGEAFVEAAAERGEDKSC